MRRRCSAPVGMGPLVDVRANPPRTWTTNMVWFEVAL
jgi:hypothetical protein